MIEPFEDRLRSAVEKARRLTERAAASGASDRDQRDRDAAVREAAALIQKVAVDTGLDGLLREEALRDGSAAATTIGLPVREEDIEAAHISDGAGGRVFARAALASHLNLLRVGIMSTKIGRVFLASVMQGAAGRGSWLMENERRQGVDSDGARREMLTMSVVGLAAVISSETGCSDRAALSFAVTEFAPQAAGLGVMIDVEAIRRRLTSKSDRLSRHFRSMRLAVAEPGMRERLRVALLKYEMIARHNW